MNIMKIENNDIGKRLDKYLGETTDYTRSKIQKMIENGNILVNNNKVKSSYILKEEDNIEITDYIEETDILPENIPLDIYYEDDDLIVVNKPSGMVVHPAPGNYSGTLVNALMYHTNNLSTVNTSIRPGIVHRIDADTSGLLLVAKNDKSHNLLAEAIQKKEVVREYIALVDGVINEDTATIDAPIGRDINNRKKMCVTGSNSKEAVTHIRVLERYKNATLIRCKLETGRTHQIRVHLSYIGHPVINDPVYNSKKLIDKDFGQMLHAEKLGFVHPTTKEYMEFAAPLPAKFNEILKIYKEEK
ncbi:MAG: RluA family pseudouridine synthase [Bacilli bacterium]